jgi:hypothetical protein
MSVQRGFTCRAVIWKHIPAFDKGFDAETEQCFCVPIVDSIFGLTCLQILITLQFSTLCSLRYWQRQYIIKNKIRNSHESSGRSGAPSVLYIEGPWIDYLGDDCTA